MMSMQRLNSLLAAAEIKRTDGAPNSDEFVIRKLTEDRAERLDLLGKIMNDGSVSDQAEELESEIAAIDYALAAYSELATS